MRKRRGTEDGGRMTENGQGQLFIRFWRILNSALLVMAFIAPWELFFSNMGGPRAASADGKFSFTPLILCCIILRLSYVIGEFTCPSCLA